MKAFFNLSMIIFILAFLTGVQDAVAKNHFDLVRMFPGVPASFVDAIKAWNDFLLYCGLLLISLLSAPRAFNRAFGQAAAVLAVAIAVGLMTMATSIAGDLPLKAQVKSFTNPFAQPYDLGRCGAYFGVNSMGSTSAVKGDNVLPGTQVAQGAIGGTVGYGCPITAGGTAFWFAEVMADVTNLNGANNGLALNGPASFTERFGVGTPISNMLSLFPSLSGANAPAVPNLPTLPAGITAGAGNPYLFVALHQDDISGQLGLAQNREWLLSWGVGLGSRYRLSNNVVADVFAEYTGESNSLCVGPFGQAACEHKGQGARVGFQLLY